MLVGLFVTYHLARGWH